ncbi:MAG: FRG domain-containing protein [Clostridia bacterium]|nr:FRG domain-containing protein [Clostridia bacterium]
MIIKSLTEYISAIEQLKKKYTCEVANQGANHTSARVPNFIYRGQGNYKKNLLIPGVFRWTKGANGEDLGEYSQFEHNILADFISEGCRYIMDVPTSDLVAWLEIAQHFGAPTRLLDFTENPLVALYFACSNLIDTNASVWIINESAYNESCFGSSILFPTQINELISNIVEGQIVARQSSESCSEYPVIYRPAYREERMASQSSVFMLWGKNRVPLTDMISEEGHMSFDDKCSSDGLICYFEIPKSCKKQILNQLNELGVNEKFIFPGLDGVGKYIKKKYSVKK